MNDTKPTAIALEVVTQESAVLRAWSSRRGQRGGTRPAPARDRHGDDAARQQDAEGGHEVRGEVEAVTRRHVEDARPELLHHRVLDLLLLVPARDERLDEGSLAVGLRRVGDVQRSAADVAHHLVLDVMEGGARRDRQGGGGRQERQGERDGCNRSSRHERPSSSGITFVRMNASSTA
jgi:hypothetical protein